MRVLEQQWMRAYVPYMYVGILYTTPLEGTIVVIWIFTTRTSIHREQSRPVIKIVVVVVVAAAVVIVMHSENI